MSTTSFRSVFMVASCAGAALGCYLVSLRVASERAALEDVETEIVLAQRDIRLLQTEIGTRGRLAQLERWNAKALALSAPSADQFLDGEFALARLVAPEREPNLEAPVVLASAPADAPKPHIEGVSEQAAERGSTPKQLMHVASLKTRPAREAKAEDEAPVADSTKTDKPKPAATKAAPAKAATGKPAETASSKARKQPAKAETAKADPLAPLAGPAKPRKIASATSKDSAGTR